MNGKWKSVFVGLMLSDGFLYLGHRSQNAEFRISLKYPDIIEYIGELLNKNDEYC